MTTEEFKEAWESQSSRTRVTVDAAQLDAETRRFQQRFAAGLFWRDVREIGTALMLILLWLYLGRKLPLPWTWFLMVPALAWIAGYLLTDRLWNTPAPVSPDEPLCRRLEWTLAQVEQQIRLLGSVLWWCLLPIAIPMLAFVGHVALLTGSADWLTVLVFSAAILFAGGILFAVDALNRYVVRTELMPRRDELRNKLRSLQETSDEGEFETKL